MSSSRIGSSPVSPTVQLVTHADLLQSRMAMLHSSTFLIRRASLLDGIGLVNEAAPQSQNEDWDLLLRASARRDIVHVDDTTGGRAMGRDLAVRSGLGLANRGGAMDHPGASRHSDQRARLRAVARPDRVRTCGGRRPAGGGEVGISCRASAVARAACISGLDGRSRNRRRFDRYAGITPAWAEASELSLPKGFQHLSAKMLKAARVWSM